MEVYQLLSYVMYIPEITLIDLWPLFKVLHTRLPEGNALWFMCRWDI